MNRRREDIGELRYKRESSKEEKRHEAMRITFTYLLLNVVSIVLIHLLIAPVISPHEYEPVLADRTRLLVFKGFCGLWALLTAFYNCLLGCYGYRWMRKKWMREESQGHLNRYRNPKYDVEEEEGVDTDVGTDLDKDGKRKEYVGPGSKIWFANNNPYTAARRTHSATFAATRRSKRLSCPVGRLQNYTKQEPIAEETADVGVEANKDRWGDGNMSEGGAGEFSDSAVGPAGDGAPRCHADGYPFPKEEKAPSSTTTWSNSATSAGELARKKKGKNEAKKFTIQSEDTERPEENENLCNSPISDKVRFRTMDARSSSPLSSIQGSGSSRYRSKRETARRVTNPDPPTSSGEGSSNILAHQSEASRESSTNGSSESCVKQDTGKLDRRRSGSNSRSSLEREDHFDPVRERSRAVKNIMTYGSYHDQQAAFDQMNHAIWSEVGAHMQRRVRIDDLPLKERDEDKIGNRRKKKRWWSLGLKKKSKEIEMTDITVGSVFEKQPTLEPNRRRLILVSIAIATFIMTTMPPFLAIGGDLIAHDFQFQHACDQARWDIRLDTAGLHPEQNNIYNRATFEDRRAKGYEKQFMMNLEGMSTYGAGLDFSLVNPRRGYVFYLSDRDLANQPDGGKDVKFPYPVVVAYDMLKHAYYAHDDIWRDLNDESFFDNGAFMNGTLGIFPSESIWLEKRERDGYCGQPKRVLKNGYDQRIIWTVIDDRKDCTVLRVCASNKATRRQVVIATGMILLRLTMSATCCSKKFGEFDILES
ncbi:hypothetical protein TWF694_001188 [Orbilia ellipsospora]|uniref:Uncharacterized protein n=1 Tax=Orbilia ellipsospora TaxID=2528407 RepID=A0AAV9XQX7_9PEZI